MEGHRAIQVSNIEPRGVPKKMVGIPALYIGAHRCCIEANCLKPFDPAKSGKIREIRRMHKNVLSIGYTRF